MNNAFNDIRYGLRLLYKNPGFTLVAIFALALGIGAVTTQFSVINGALFKGLPFDDSEELMHLERRNVDTENYNAEIPVHDLLDISARQTSFEALSGWFGGTVNVAVDGAAYRYSGSRISHNFLDQLRKQPILGRGFTPEDDQPGAPKTIILGYGVWQRDFGGDPNVIGKAVRVNTQPATVIGVMERDFVFPFNDDCWVPLQSALNPEQLERGGGYSLEVMGRLRPGVTPEQAEAEMTGLLAQLAEAYPETNEGYREAVVKPYIEEFLWDQVRQTLWIMLASGVFVLLIASANVANLQLARAAMRTKELAIRTALGASRGRLLRQLLTESLVIASVGAIGGVLIALGAIRLLTNYTESIQMPFWFNFSLDGTVLLVVIAVTVFTGLISGLMPAIKASRPVVNNILKDDSRTGSSLEMGRFSKGLVVFQIAVSCLLLILAGLQIRSIDNLRNQDVGFDADGVLAARMGMFEGDYPEAEDRRRFLLQLRDNVTARPEVASASLYSRYRWWPTNGARITIEGGEYADFEDHPFTRWEIIGPDYFKTMGVELIEGREFNLVDGTEDAMNVAIINESFAQRFFPGQNPIGLRFKRERWPNERDANVEGELRRNLDWHTVIGIAPDIAMQGLGNQDDSEGSGYYLQLQDDWNPRFMTLVAKPRDRNPMGLAGLFREEVLSLDPNLPLYAVASPGQIIREDSRQGALVANIFNIFGLTAIFLASIGLYAVMSFSVNQRRREFGIRAALGAIPHMLLRLVMRQGMIQLAIGLVLGVAGALAFAQLLSNQLFGVEPEDPTVYMVVLFTLTAVALIASFVPARRASQVHPMEALRYE